MQVRIENILEEMQPAANISQLTKCKHDEVGKTKNHFLNINNDAQESAMREEKREREWKSGEGKSRAKSNALVIRLISSDFQIYRLKNVKKSFGKMSILSKLGKL